MREIDECDYFCHRHKAIKHEGVGCRECNKEKYKASLPAKQKKIYTIPKVSKEKAKRERELAKVRAPRKKAATGCESCTSPEGPLDYSHTLPVGQYPEYEADPENAVVECRKCHMVWQDGTLEQKMKLKTFDRRLAYIIRTEPAYWNKMQLKQAI